MRIFRPLAVLACLALVTAGGMRLAVNASTAGFSYLLVILLIATFGTLWEAVAASFVAALCLNYFFLPPLFRFTIASPQDWIALLVFLATAVLVSKLSATARAQTESALARGREMERLYALSRGVLLNTAPESTARDTAFQIARVFHLRAVSLLERATGSIHRAGELDLPEWDARLREAALNGTRFDEPETGTLAASVRLGADTIGALVLRGDPISDSALQSLSNLVAIALERARMQESTNAAELIRKSEELKSTLLDAIAHEFKTPLTSIKAAASSLRAGIGDLPARQVLVEVIDEEADRLERLVTDAIHMARIEEGELKLDRREYPAGSVLELAAAPLHSLLDGRELHREIEPGLTVYADVGLLQLALRQVLDNALKYSPARSAISVSACVRDGEILFAAHNSGPGIPDSERHRIFERYYRSIETREHVPGTGIGLAIAREIVIAHGGRIWAESRPGQGTTVSMALPRLASETGAP